MIINSDKYANLGAVKWFSLPGSAICEQMLAKGKIRARQTVLEGLFDKNPAAAEVSDEPQASPSSHP
jgi:hypothetical protein